LPQLKTCLGIRKTGGHGIGQLLHNHFKDMPRAYAAAYAAGHGGAATYTRDVHVKNGVPLSVREERTDSGQFMDVLQPVFHRHDWL
jgi:hypothetical protein